MWKRKSVEKEEKIGRNVKMKEPNEKLQKCVMYVAILTVFAQKFIIILLTLSV